MPLTASEQREFDRLSQKRSVREKQPPISEVRQAMAQAKKAGVHRSGPPKSVGVPRYAPDTRKGAGMPRPRGSIGGAGGPSGKDKMTPLGGFRRMSNEGGPPQGGLSAMLQKQGADKNLLSMVREVESMPGGMELLYTVAAEKMMTKQGVPSKTAKKIRLYSMGGEVKLARGGSTRQAAERTRRAGRGDDSIMLHLSPEEAEVISAMWGPPEINPNTGIGEYGFLSKIWKKVKKAVKKIVSNPIFQVVAPIALNAFFPGLGAAIGTLMTGGGTAAAGAAMAAGGVGSSLMATTVGNAVIQGGLGAVAGGKEGAIKGAFSGAITGGLGAAVGESLPVLELEGATARTVGDALLSGAGSSLSGGTFTEGAITGGLQTAAGLQPDQIAAGAKTAFTGMGPKNLMGPALSAKQGAVRVAKKYALPALLMGAADSAANYEEEPPPDWAKPGFSGGEGFGEALPQYSMDRKFQGLDSAEDYFTYGQAGAPTSGQHLFIDPPDPFAFSDEAGEPVDPLTGLAPIGQLTEEQLREQLGQAGMPYMSQRGGKVDYWAQNADVFNTTPTVSAQGGKQEGNGRSDDIPAWLSEGEYVIDAESVALLGDGSGDAGARRLDEMRRNLRKHKAKNLGKGQFSHKAKSPDQYMNKLRRKAKYEHGGVHNV